MAFQDEYGFVPRFVVDGTSESFPSLHEALRNSHSPEVDTRALSVFFRTGIFLDGATPFKRIRRFAPPPLIVQLNTTLSREQAIDAFIDVFRAAVARLIVPSSVIGLSGGQDSRHILLELARAKALPDYAITVDVPNINDLAVARMLCKMIELEHRVFKPSHSLEDERWKNIVTNLSSMQHGWLCNVVRERDHRAWWDGIGGDVLSAGLFLEASNLELFRRDRLDELANRLVSTARDTALPSFIRVPRDDVLEMMRRELERHRLAANPVGSFYFWNRTRVDIASAPFSLLVHDGQKALVPYLDRDVYQLLASLPGEYFLDHSFHSEAIRRAHPDFQHVPYSFKRPLGQRSVAKTAACLMEIARGKLDNKYRSRSYVLLRAVRALLVAANRSDIGWIRREAAYLQSLREIQSLDILSPLGVPLLC